MSCDAFDKELVLHADGELRGQASLTLLAHLQTCPECSQRVIAHQQFRASIARVMGELTAPAELRASISAALEADARREAMRQASRQQHRRVYWPAAIAAVFALAVVGAWHYRPWATKTVTAADVQPVRATDEGPVAVEIARNVHKLHIRCAMQGPAHQDASLGSNAQAAAARMGQTLGISVLTGDRLRLDVGQARFESARICQLPDARNTLHPAAHLIYRNRADEPISLFSTRSFSDLTGLRTRSVNGRSYAVLAPGISTKCHPFTILVWSSGPASFLACAPFTDEEALQYIDPIRVAIERDPSLADRLLAALPRCEPLEFSCCHLLPPG